MYDVKVWRHIFKLDPNKEISDDHLELICESGTDAVMVGGSDGVTPENVFQLMARIRRYAVPCVLEISTIESITPGFDFYFIPTVLNSKNPRWILDLHHKAIKEFGHLINWNEIFVEGYCILNKECKAAHLTEANTELQEEDIVAYAELAEKMFHLPIFYLEYSGTYGDVQIVQSVKDCLEETRLFYGGGIESESQAREMGNIADTIVVGNIIYSDIDSALKTVQSIKASL